MRAQLFTKAKWAGALALAVCLFAGCIDKRIIWSPDGQRAVVLSDAGLYLCDSQGALSGLLDSNVAAAAWFPDSMRLAVARAVEYSSWTELAPLLPPTRRERIAGEARTELAALKMGRTPKQAAAEVIDADVQAVQLCVKETAGEQEALGTNWDKVAGTGAWLMVVEVATNANGKLTFGPPLASELAGIEEMRVSPDGRTIAYVCDTTVPATGLELHVVSADGSGPARWVDSSVAQFPDWTPDSLALVYIKAVGLVSKSDQLQLASLTRRFLSPGPNGIVPQDKAEEMVATIFNKQARVRCLPNGRILFSGVEWRLPSSAAEMPNRQQLFSFAPGQAGPVAAVIPSAALDKVPQDTSFFEVDPSGRRVAIVDKGLLAVLDLTTGVVQTAPRPADDDTVFLPVWRTTAELCYSMVEARGTNQAVLWDVSAATGQPRILSAAWPKAVRKDLLDP